MISDVDVAISGAGVGGALLALALGRARMRVLLVEPGPGIPTRGADILEPRGIRILREHGVLPALLHKGAVCRDVIRYYYHDGQPLFELDFTEHSDLGYYLIAPYRSIVECLLDACAAHPSISVEFNPAVAHVDPSDRTGHRVHFHSGQSVRAAVVVGADGPRSTVLGRLGAEPLAVRSYDHVLRVGTLTTPLADSHGNRLYFGSTGSFAYLYPLDAATARIFVGLPATLEQRLLDQLGEMLVEHLRSFVPDSAQLPLLADLAWQPMPVGSWHAPRIAGGAVAVLGHTAFSAHSMTGLGMSISLEHATIIATAIIDAVHAGELPARRYAPRRHRHGEVIAYGDALATSFADAHEYRRRFQPRLHCGDR
jgi:2-polyprenyl-6-methoxyphenol hydroxylase-like FAD-dependent oxidoreductase